MGIELLLHKRSLFEHSQPFSLGSFDFRSFAHPLKPAQGLITGTKRGQERTGFFGQTCTQKILERMILVLHAKGKRSNCARLRNGLQELRSLPEARGRLPSRTW